MRKFRAIVQDNLEPLDKEVLWLYNGHLKYWNIGRWNDITIDTDLISKVIEVITEVTVYKEDIEEIKKNIQSLSDDIKIISEALNSIVDSEGLIRISETK